MSDSRPVVLAVDDTPANLDLLREILSEDPSEVNRSFGYGTPIHYASLWGQPETVQFLLDNDADPNIRHVHIRAKGGVDMAGKNSIRIGGLMRRAGNNNRVVERRLESKSWPRITRQEYRRRSQ